MPRGSEEKQENSSWKIVQDGFSKLLQRSEGDDRGRSRDSARSSSAPNSRATTPTRPRRIRTVKNFGELYKIGGEVMPSTHKYIKVLFARRVTDGEECVVKTRSKPSCFRSEHDELSWRRRTETLLNWTLPPMSGVCRLHEVLEDSEAFYIVMERVKGADLHETLDAEGPMSVETAREILRSLLVTVTLLHRNNMLHKDLKLENVMINNGQKPASRPKREKGSHPSTFKLPPRGVDGTAVIKVIDFDTLDEWTPKTPLSKSVVGTDQYIAPEAYAGKYSPLSDVFSVGVIAYKLVTGKFPFSEDIFDDTPGENQAGTPQMNAIRRRLKLFVVDFTSNPVWRENAMLLDLVTKMLSYFEHQRPTASVALEHPFFRDGAPSGGHCALRADFDEDLLDDEVIIAESIVTS